MNPHNRSYFGPLCAYCPECGNLVLLDEQGRALPHSRKEGSGALCPLKGRVLRVPAPRLPVKLEQHMQLDRIDRSRHPRPAFNWWSLWPYVGLLVLAGWLLRQILK